MEFLPIKTLGNVTKFVVSRLVGGAFGELADQTMEVQPARIEYVSTWTEEEWQDLG